MKDTIVALLLTILLVHNFGSGFGRPVGDAVATQPVADTSSCHSMTKTEVGLMPGWSVLEEKVKAEYGDFSDYYVNWSEQPGYDAFVCADGLKAKFGPVKEGECKKQTSELRGTLMTEGIVATSVYSGFEASSEVTVTQSTQFGAGVSVGISIELFMVTIGTTVSVSTTVTNTKSSSVRKTSSSAVISTVRIKPLIGNNCYVRLHFESCSFTSDGSVPVLATGWVWFELKTKTKGRKRVAYLLEMVLTENQRSVPIPLSISIDTKANGDFDSNCVCVDSACQALISSNVLDANGKAKNATAPINALRVMTASVADIGNSDGYADDGSEVPEESTDEHTDPLEGNVIDNSITMQ